MNHYPFSAIVGQDLLKLALLACAISPSIGGVLIRGDKGSAKSTAARALADVLPSIARRPGCGFNCEQGAEFDECLSCSEGKSDYQELSVPFVTLPLGASEDRLIGALNLDKALKAGTKTFQPGLLAAAHRGILYIDEVNLLPDHLVDMLLDSAASGWNSVEREGFTLTHPSRFTLIGTMNPEEGELRPQFLDRFGLVVDVEAPVDPTERSEIVRRRIRFEQQADAFWSAFHGEQQNLRSRIAKAKHLLARVEVAGAELSLIGALCSKLGVKSLRADLVMYKTAMAIAALAERERVNLSDIELAAKLALPHRKRAKPQDKSNRHDQSPEQLLQELAAEQQDNENDSDDSEPQPPEQTFQPIPIDASLPLSLQAVSPALSGSRTTFVSTNDSGGPLVRTVQNHASGKIAVVPTITNSLVRNAGALDVQTEDVRFKQTKSKQASLIVFLVDASGSMAAQQRMQAVKGAVMSLLDEAYQYRDFVAVVSCRGEQADVLLPPTRSIDTALEALAQLPTGGRTPLAGALDSAKELIETNSRKPNALSPLLVVLSDGKANVATSTQIDPWQDTLNKAQELQEMGVTSVVIDTESGYVRFGHAAKLAAMLGAELVSMEELTAEGLVHLIRQTHQRRRR